METVIPCIALLNLCGLLPNSLGTNNELSVNRNIAQTARSEEVVARGTEPFWSITVSRKGIVYSSPEVKKQTFPYVAPLRASGRSPDQVRVYRLRGKDNNILIIQKVNSCSDGMSEIDYPYSATLILGNRVLSGCAEK